MRWIAESWIEIEPVNYVDGLDSMNPIFLFPA